MADGANSHAHRFGSLFQSSPFYDAQVRKKVEGFGFLERICQQIEPTETQQQRAKTAYEAVGAWLSGEPLLANALIYAQGSAAHGTTIKPIGRNEHDVDLICRVVGYGRDLPPATLKRMVGDRLRAHGAYRELLEEMPRCWRLNYAGDFHLDITPSIPNPACAQGGELVPDRIVQSWKASNPAGFRDLFARRAQLKPFVQAVAKSFDGARADVQPFPAFGSVKGVLRRLVQLLKHHRDVDFQRKDKSLAPLSIIITSLASRAYEHCVTTYPYDNEMDLLCDTIRAMLWFIEREVVGGSVHWVVKNETTDGENFAEKWNTNPERCTAFFTWHAKALADFEAFRDAVGLDTVQKQLSDALGEEPIRKALSSLTDEIGGARNSGSLIVRPGVGLATGAAAAAAATPVRANTFFGRPIE